MVNSNTGKTDTAEVYSNANTLASKGFGVTQQHAFENWPQNTQYSRNV